MRRVVTLLGVIPLLALDACEGADSAFDRGYGDGYAVGYNATCEIRTTLVAGDWDNKHYSRGFADGQTDGAIACINDRRAGARAVAAIVEE